MTDERRGDQSSLEAPVGALMTRQPLMISGGTTVQETAAVMIARGLSSALVRPAPFSTEYGIITMRDVVSKVVRRGRSPAVVRVAEIVTWRPVTVPPEATARAAAVAMAERRIRRLPVVTGGAIIGLISDTDLFTALVPEADWPSVRRVRKERARRRAARPAVWSVEHLMSAPVLTARADHTVHDAVRKMLAAGVSSLLVPEGDGSSWGIMTKRDVVTKVIARGTEPRAILVREVLSRPVVTISASTSIQRCSERMVAHRVRRFPVVRGDDAVGIISDSDILAAVAVRHWQDAPRPAAAIVADVMRAAEAGLRPVSGRSVTPELSLWSCATVMAEAGIRAVPVVQDGRLIGVVEDIDIVGALQERGGPD